MAEHRLGILHVSDLHVRTDEGAGAWRRGQVLGPRWDENLDAFLQDGPIDLVCFTSDLAFGGKAEEYAQLTPFVEALLARVGVPRERLFVVPGNHDMDRDVAVPAWTALREMGWEEGEALSRWMAGGRPPARVTEAWRDRPLRLPEAAGNSETDPSVGLNPPASG